jgi:hypothetical protein
MRSKITVIGAPGVVDTLMEGDIADVVGDEGLPGSDVVVIGAGADVAQAARRAASRAPGAALIVVGGDVRAALEASLLPRGRVFGVTGDRLREAVEAVVLDRRATIDVEMVGLDDRVVTAAASLGAGGIRELRRR